MGFIRTKILKGNHYAYYVENSWKKKTSKQKVKQYLGRVHAPLKQYEVDFLSFVGYDELSIYLRQEREKILEDLIAYVLYTHGFKKNDSCVWCCSNIYVNLENHSITSNNKNVALKINEGFLCEQTLRDIYVGAHKGRSREAALTFARQFIDAGINIPKDIFVALFEKLNKV
jgi:hypothetical protein